MNKKVQLENFMTAMDDSDVARKFLKNLYLSRPSVFESYWQQEGIVEIKAKLLYPEMNISVIKMIREISNTINFIPLQSLRTCKDFVEGKITIKMEQDQHANFMRRVEDYQHGNSILFPVI